MCSVCAHEAAQYSSQDLAPIDVPEELDCIFIEQLTHDELVRVQAMDLAIKSTPAGMSSDFWLFNRAKEIEKFLKGETNA